MTAILMPETFPHSFELLAKHHERVSFDCGVLALNEFLQKEANQQQRRNLNKTWVKATQEGEIKGFVTLCVGQMSAQNLSAHLKLPRYPIPLLRIARLAVNKTFHGQGLGKELLAFSLDCALNLAKEVGLYAVFVDAKNAKAANFYQHFGFSPGLDNPLCLFLPLLSLQQVKNDSSS